MVAGERTSRAVRTVQAWREADDEQPVSCMPKGCNRPAVIVRMLVTDVVKKARESRAPPAGRIERGARGRTPALHRALNCASSVDPRIAVIEELPPLTVCVTSSK